MASAGRGRLHDVSPGSSRESSQSSGWFNTLSEAVLDQLQELGPEQPILQNEGAVASVNAPLALAPWTFQKIDLRRPPPPPPPNPPVFTDNMDNARVSMDHKNGTCDPCIFFSSQRGCVKGSACPYCHLGNHFVSEKVKAIHRPRKQTRDKYKSVVQKLLQQLELNPDQIHEELQSEARKSPYVRKLLQGYLDGTDLMLDPDTVPTFHMVYAPAYSPMALPPLPPVPMHHPLAYPVPQTFGGAPAPHLAVARPLYGR